MSERNKITNLFQENFKNFEVIPDEIVWENIEKKLDEKKKRRILPFWWKLSGIAGALVIGIFIEINNSQLTVNATNTVVNQAKETIKSKINTTCTTLENSPKKQNSTIVSIENNSNSNTKDEIKISNSNKTESSKVNEETLFATRNAKNYNSIKNTHKGIKTNKFRENTTLISSTNSQSKIAFDRAKHKISRIVTNTIVLEDNTPLVEKTIKKVEKVTESNNLMISQESNSNLSNLNSFEQNKSISNTTIETDETINKTTDSIKIAVAKTNALEELLKEKESKSVAERKLNKWQISSNVAPIYFSSISKGSPLDNTLAANEKSYSANNQSYGVGLNYVLNKKLKIRTGINILTVDYNTNGISYYYQSASVTGKLTNLNPNAAGSSIIIESLNNVNRPFTKIGDRAVGSLNQKLGYIEMPLELSYKILNKKLGIDFIGGMSTMVLNKNEIYLQSSNLNLKIGEASNLNSLHFSGNLGLGFKYNILKQLEAHLEPAFKYQFNTFSNDAGNFKPYVFGVYSGVNFSF
jgi:hypothetical protein